MVFPFPRLDSMGYTCLDSMEYVSKLDNTWEDYYYALAFPEESSLQRGGNIPFYCGPVLQRGDMDSEVSLKVLLGVSCCH